MSGDGVKAELAPGPEDPVEWAEIQAYLKRILDSINRLDDLERHHATARGRSEGADATVADHHVTYVLGNLLQAAKIAQLGQIDLKPDEPDYQI